MTAAAGTAARPSYRTAGAIALAIFVLYLVTLAPTIGLWDAGEYVAAAARFGIPHPPGNPGFILLGRVVSLLPIAPTVALRLNVLVALASALSAGLWFLVSEHVCRHWLEPRTARVGAAASAILGATAFTVWNQSVINEKVYTISLFLLVLDVWTAIRWQQDPDGPRADRRLALICYRLGLGYTVHIAGLLAGPAVLAAVLTTRPGTLRRGRFLLLCGGLFVLGFTPFLSLPIRAAFPLEINEGHPTACEEGRPQWGCTFSAKTLDRFLYAHNRTQYAKPPLLDRQESFPNQVRMWWLYFKWQWMRDVPAASPEGQSALAVLMLLLACYGGWAHWRHDRETFYPFATLIATLTIGLIYYLNFKLGFSQATAMRGAGQHAQEARDRDYFFLWSYSALAVWIGLGLSYAWRASARFVAGFDGSPDGAPAREPRTKEWSIASALLLVALVPLALNASASPRRGETFAEDFAIDLLNSVEPNGVLFTGGDNDSFPLWFAQQVLGVRRDVSLVLIPYLNTEWYVHDLIARRPEPYDSLAGPRIYRGTPHLLPTRPLLSLTRQQADSIPEFTDLAQPRRLQMPGFELELPAGKVPREVLIMLRIIHDAGAERPVYFSHGAGTPEFLNPYFLTQGLARRITPDVAAVPGSAATRDVGRIDVARTQALWDIFRARGAIQRQGMWLDEASANIPFSYITVGLALSQAQGATGNNPASAAVRAQTIKLAEAMDIARYTRRSQRIVKAPTGLGYAPVSAK